MGNRMATQWQTQDCSSKQSILLEVELLKLLENHKRCLKFQKAFISIHEIQLADRQHEERNPHSGRVATQSHPQNGQQHK